MVDPNQVYLDNGYDTRYDYLNSLAENYGDHVFILSEVLGPEEDFDGLVTTLEDHGDFDEDFGNHFN